MFLVPIAIPGRNETVDRVAHDIGGRTKEHPFRRVVEEQYPLILIHGYDRVHGGLEYPAVAAFARSNVLLSHPAVRNIDADAHHSNGIAANVVRGPAAGPQPPNFSRGPDCPELHFQDASIFDSAVSHLPYSGNIVRMYKACKLFNTSLDASASAAAMIGRRVRPLNMVLDQIPIPGGAFRRLERH